jgi:cell wall-associated NlpC family hydrolase
MMLDRQKFIDDARALVKQGVIFRHQGSDPITGLDCINLPRYLCEQQGMKLPPELEKEFESYSENPDGWRLLEIMRRWFVELESSSAGDLLILYARRNPKHLAIQISDDAPPMIVEAYRSESDKTGRLIEQPLDFRRRVAARFRIPDFAPQA